MRGVARPVDRPVHPEYKTIWLNTRGTCGLGQEVVAPERLVMTESWGGDWPETLNTLVLTEQAGKTTMTLTVLYPSKEACERAMGTGMKDGMAMSFNGLAEYLGTMA
jgi:uncharacterized protein YndB with AHSA1/START domain